MQNKKITTILSIITLALTAIASVPFGSSQSVTTHAFLSIRPDPIGVGQSLLINAWIIPLPYPDVYENIVFTITAPNGTAIDIGPLSSFLEGTMWFEYIPDVVGDWSISFSFPGDDGHLACTSPTTEFTVQEEPIPSWPGASLPTDYWTRPINSDNREWYQISGDWPQIGHDAAKSGYNPYTSGPNTAHVLWTYQTALGGLTGGEYGSESFGYGGMGNPKWVMAGLAYMDRVDGLHCIDIKTGETRWIKPITITGVMHGDPEQGGHRPELLKLGSTFRKYDALTGDLVKEVEGMSGTYVEPYVYSTQVVNDTRYLIKWDARESLTGATNPITTDFQTRIVYNVTWPLTGTSLTSISYIWQDVALSINNDEFGAFNMTTGEKLWSKPLDVTLELSSSGCVGYGKFFINSADPPRVFQAYNIYTGEKEWTSEEAEYPWGSFWAYTSGVGYENVYGLNYDGHVYAFDVDTGEINWKFYSGDSGLETSYGHWPFWSVSHLADAPVIADGKVYADTYEHSLTQPPMRGTKLFAIDVNTGTEVWNISGSISPGSISDGVLIGVNNYDGLLYAFSKGPTTTTVDVSPKVVKNGDSVIIEGTVLDQSPAQQGTPAVSKESMTTWMEYLHMQKPIPDGYTVTGVPVTLTAITSDGSVIEIGNTVSDLGGFKFEWTPPDDDLYTIVASFASDDSYSSSWASTGLSVGETQESQTSDDYRTADLLIIAGVITAIVIGTFNIWALRKQK